jgi:hypothetical protein
MDEEKTAGYKERRREKRFTALDQIRRRTIARRLNNSKSLIPFTAARN